MHDSFKNKELFTHVVPKIMQRFFLSKTQEEKFSKEQ